MLENEKIYKNLHGLIFVIKGNNKILYSLKLKHFFSSSIYTRETASSTKLGTNSFFDRSLIFWYRWLIVASWSVIISKNLNFKLYLSCKILTRFIMDKICNASSNLVSSSINEKLAHSWQNFLKLFKKWHQNSLSSLILKTFLKKIQRKKIRVY